jgi:rfaE bifunctional protein kinase chain/domain
MTTSRTLPDLLQQFTRQKVIVVGDVMVDEYLWGNVSRVSPEAPVPVVSCNQREHRMGGAANVAINVKSLGAEPIMCSVIGTDDSGTNFKSLLKKAGMTDEGIVESRYRTTTVKTRVIGNHQHLLRVDHEMTDFLKQDIEALLIDRIRILIKKYKAGAVIFQDYDKGVLTPRVISETVRMASDGGMVTLVDPKKRSFNYYRDVTLFKPNFKELVEGLNVIATKDNPAAIAEAVKVFHEERGVQNVMVTLSEKGVFISGGLKHTVIPAEVRDITDVSGAGDTVASVAALALACGLSPLNAAALANLAGGIVCEKVGVVSITPEMLLKETFHFPEE